MTWLRNTYSPIGTPTWQFFGPPDIRDEPMSPIKCFITDTLSVFTNFRLIHVVLASFPTDRSIDELFLWASTVQSLIWFTFWSLVQAPFVLFLLFFYLITAAVLSIITTLHSFFIWRIIQGPQFQCYPPTLPTHPKFNPRQRWVYINGIATGKTITRQNLECLSATFHNPVLAINNRTYGFLGDLVECIMQRSFGFRTKETHIATTTIKQYLNDRSIDTVILIAHSQGGILASQILEDLYCEVCPSEISKLEVYTFGSAALTFKIPFRDETHSARLISTVEHYCNERDMVTRWGALASADRDEIPFVGKVFVFQGQTGHMLNQHYLKYMFTGAENTWAHDEFHLRAVRRDGNVPGKFWVTARRGEGEETLKGMGKLWTYM